MTPRDADQHAPTADSPATDPYLWLEDVEGERALAWVRARNAEAEERLGGASSTAPALAELEADVLEVLDSHDKIPDVSALGDRLYNFWRDDVHVRGVWRRTTLDSYRTDSPVWETVLDLDALAEEEGESWVWHGASALRPTDPDAPWRRAIVDLSRGGSDADVSREVDLVEKRIVPPDEGGFHRDEAKGGLAWIDEDTVYVFTDFGPGPDGEPTTTTSGYPRVVKRWRRGTPLADAETVYAGRADDLYISAHRARDTGYERDLVSRSIAFYEDELYWLDPAGELRLVDVPRSAEASPRREWLLVELREPWTVQAAPGEVTHPAGALLAARFDDFMAGSRDLTVLFEPTATTSLAGATWTEHHLVVNVLDDVKNRLHVLTPPASDAAPGTPWARSPLPGAPAIGTTGVRPVDSHTSDDVWLVTTDYLTPTTLSLAHVAGPEDPAPATPERLKAMPAFFDATGLEVTQHFATSDDGTRVPYFQIGPADAPPGPRPTLQYGYGGFEISLTPGYSGGLGRAWLARGGTYVVANIRGGGEYGPAWHQAALKEHRHRAYEDFAAVARDLVARGVTTPAHLGAQGGSNGGLLMGNMLTQYPELFGAIVCQVPLLDMRRYTKLLAGASWAAEYGDPDDPEQWEFIRTFSPYHLVDPARAYPPVLFTTSTRDDRVHPGHARKMAALLLEGGRDVTSWENVEGGHGGAADNKQAAHMAAIAYRFLWERLG
jgi:prolyl oligopeptidase